MANYFDQFDDPDQQPAPTKNFFDQFDDAGPFSPAVTPSPTGLAPAMDTSQTQRAPIIPPDFVNQMAPAEQSVPAPMASVSPVEPQVSSARAEVEMQGLQNELASIDRRLADSALPETTRRILLYRRQQIMGEIEKAGLPNVADSIQPTDKFAGEPVGSLLKRRGQQVMQSATDFAASQTQGMAISAAQLERGFRGSIEEGAEQTTQELAEIDKMLAEPNRPPRQVELLQRRRDALVSRLKDIEIKQQTISETPMVPASARKSFKLGEELSAASERVFGKPDPDDEGFWAAAAGGLGSYGGIAATTLGTGALTGPGGALASGSLGGSNMVATQIYKEAKASGADEETALDAAQWGALIGTTEVIPIFTAFKVIPSPFRQRVMGKVGKYLADIAMNSGEEAAQEAASQIAQNLVASKYYDPERGWSEGVTESATIGAMLGGGVATATGAREALRRDQEPPTPGEPPSTPPTPAQPSGLAPPQTETSPGFPNVPASPLARRDPQRLKSPRLTEADRASPLRNDLIDEGKQIIEEATGEAPSAAPQRTEIVPEVETVDGQSVETGRLIEINYDTGETRVVGETPETPAAPVSAPVAAPGPQQESLGVRSTQAAPERSERPRPPQKRPFTRKISAVGIDPDGFAAAELRAADVTPQTAPGLFRRGGLKDVDALVASEYGDYASIIGTEDDGTYLSRQGVLDAIIEEASGRPVQDGEELAKQALQDAREIEQRILDEGDEFLADVDETPVSPGLVVVPPSEMFTTPDQDPDEAYRSLVDSTVERAVAHMASEGETLTDAEIEFMRGRLRDNGGDAEAIAWRIVEGQYDEQSRRDQGREGGALPGADREGLGIPGFEPGTEGPSPTGLAPRGSARTGSTEGGRVDLTPEGEQRVIPGAEQITDRERAERAQARPKRGGDTPPPEGGLFDEGARAQGDLLDTPPADPLVQDFEAYAAERGASRFDFGDPGLHSPAGNVPKRTRDAQLKAQNKRDADLQRRRDELRAEYDRKVEAGEIRQPSGQERLEATAKGNEDNQSVRAARRVLENRAKRRSAATEEAEQPQDLTIEPHTEKSFILMGLSKDQKDRLEGISPKPIWNQKKGGWVFRNKAREAVEARIAETTGVEAAAAQVDTDPTDAQKEAGNYRMGHVTVQGLDITIETPKGAERTGTDSDGETWSVTMPAHYGYIKRTEGADGDHVDVYLGEQLDSTRVFVVDQIDAESKEFDEHKILIGFADEAAARSTYVEAFNDGKGEDRIGGLTELSMDEFKAWLENGDTTLPMAFQDRPTATPTPAATLISRAIDALDPHQRPGDTRNAHAIDMMEEPEARPLLEAVAAAADAPARRAAADAWVLERGQAEGVEYLVIMDPDGYPVEITAGHATGVDISPAAYRYAAATPGVYSVHNHPRSTNPSGEDIAMMRTGLGNGVILGNDGATRHHVIKVNDSIDIGDISGGRTEVANQLIEAINLGIVGGSFSDLNALTATGQLDVSDAIRINNAAAVHGMARAGLIEYEGTAKAADAIHEGVDYADAVSRSISERLRRAFPGFDPARIGGDQGLPAQEREDGAGQGATGLRPETPAGEQPPAAGRIRRAAPGVKDPLRRKGDWQDADIFATNLDGSQELVQAGPAVKDLIRTRAKAEKLLGCVNA